jgi:hypothetical protein
MVVARPGRTAVTTLAGPPMRSAAFGEPTAPGSRPPPRPSSLSPAEMPANLKDDLATMGWL